MTTQEKTVISALETLLSDSYVLYLKTQGYHWNVTGPMFTTLHTLFEQQYGELALAVDEIAERIRALGAPAPGSYKRFAELATVTEDDGVPRAEQMIHNLVADAATVSASAQRLVEVAEEASDSASADLGVRRLDAHQKAAWMLRSHVE